MKVMKIFNLRPGISIGQDHLLGKIGALGEGEIGAHLVQDNCQEEDISEDGATEI